MLAPGGAMDEDDKPFDELLAQLLDDGKAYTQAELRLIKVDVETKALAQLEAVKKTALLGAGALLFLVAGIIVLCMTLALALATLVGPLAGGLIATLVTLTVAVFLGLAAKKAFGAMS